MSTSMPGAVDTFGVATHVTGEPVPSGDFNRLQDGLRATERVVLGPGFYNVKGYGALGDGSTDDTTAIQNAINDANSIGGGWILLPAGTFVCSTLTLYSNVHLVGSGIKATILKLKNGSNASLLRSNNFASLTGGNTTGGIYNFSIQNLEIDGNKSNQSSGTSCGIQIYGYGYILNNVRVHDCYTDGIYSEWSTNSNTPGQDSMEAQYANIKVHDCTNRGINFNGPHDSQFTNIIAYYCHRPIHIDPSGTAAGCQLTNVHTWACTAGGDYSIVLGNTFGGAVNLIAEGGITGQILVLGGNIVGEAWQVFAAVAIPNSAYGIVLGDGTHSVSGCQIRASVYECQGGAINFVNDTGSSTYDIVSYLTAGSYVAGNPATTTKLRLMQGGVNAGNFIETGGIGQSWTMENQNFTPYFNFNMGTGAQEYLNGVLIRGYSDSWGTQKWQIDTTNAELQIGSFADKPTASATAIGNNATITVSKGTGAYRQAPTANVTGIVLSAGPTDGMEITVYNESAFTITFAAVGTSHVANGTSSVIAANTARSFKWNAAATLWYPLI